MALQDGHVFGGAIQSNQLWGATVQPPASEKRFIDVREQPGGGCLSMTGGSLEHLRELGFLLGDTGSPLSSRPQFPPMKQQCSAEMIFSIFSVLIFWDLGTQAKTILPDRSPHSHLDWRWTTAAWRKEWPSQRP